MSTSAADREEVEPFQARDLSASLTVQDIHESLTWYQDVMGFTVDRKYERDGKLYAVSFQAGDVRILIGQDDGTRGLERVKGEGFSLQFTTDQDIDMIADRIKKHSVTLESEPATMPWGPRVFRLKDPDGFKLVISSIPPGWTR